MLVAGLREPLIPEAVPDHLVTDLVPNRCCDRPG